MRFTLANYKYYIYIGYILDHKSIHLRLRMQFDFETRQFRFMFVHTFFNVHSHILRRDYRFFLNEIRFFLTVCSL